MVSSNCPCSVCTSSVNLRDRELYETWDSPSWLIWASLCHSPCLEPWWWCSVLLCGVGLSSFIMVIGNMQAGPYLPTKSWIYCPEVTVAFPSFSFVCFISFFRLRVFFFLQLCWVLVAAHRLFLVTGIRRWSNISCFVLLGSSFLPSLLSHASFLLFLPSLMLVIGLHIINTLWVPEEWNAFVPISSLSLIYIQWHVGKGF